MGEYVRDSTKGINVRIDPVNYKADTLVQVWIDARKLATVCQWMEKYGVNMRFMSDITKELFDIVVKQLVESGEVKMVEFSSSAHDYLKFKFNKSSLNPGERGKRNILHNAVLDDRRKSHMINTADWNGKDRDALPTGAKSSISNEEWDRAQELIKQTQVDEANKRIGGIQFDASGKNVSIEHPRHTKEDVYKDMKDTRDSIVKQINSQTDGFEESKSIQPHNGGHRKLTRDELIAKDREIAERDRRVRELLDSVNPDDLKPIG